MVIYTKVTGIINQYFAIEKPINNTIKTITVYFAVMLFCLPAIKMSHKLNKIYKQNENAVADKIPSHIILVSSLLFSYLSLLFYQCLEVDYTHFLRFKFVTVFD